MDVMQDIDIQMEIVLHAQEQHIHLEKQQQNVHHVLDVQLVQQHPDNVQVVMKDIICQIINVLSVQQEPIRLKMQIYVQVVQQEHIQKKELQIAFLVEQINIQQEMLKVVQHVQQYVIHQVVSLQRENVMDVMQDIDIQMEIV